MCPFQGQWVKREKKASVALRPVQGFKGFKGSSESEVNEGAEVRRRQRPHTEEEQQAGDSPDSHMLP